MLEKTERNGGGKQQNVEPASHKSTGTHAIGKSLEMDVLYSSTVRACSTAQESARHLGLRSSSECSLVLYTNQ